MAETPAEVSVDGDGPGAPRAQRVGEWAAKCLSIQHADSLGAEDIQALGGALRDQSCAVGQVIFHARQWPQGVWWIRNGSAELTAGNGRHRFVVALARSGDVFGDIPLLTGQPAPYRAQAVCLTTCLLLPTPAFTRLIMQRSALARLWLHSTATRVLGAQTQLLDILGGTIRQQVARLLLREARDGHVLASQASLASMLGCPRSSLNRVLQQLANDGALGLGYRRVTLLDVPRLSRVAHGDSKTVPQ